MPRRRATLITPARAILQISAQSTRWGTQTWSNGLRDSALHAVTQEHCTRIVIVVQGQELERLDWSYSLRCGIVISVDLERDINPNGRENLEMDESR